MKLFSSWYFDTSDLISLITDWLPASQSRLNHGQFPNNRLRTLIFIQIFYLNQTRSILVKICKNNMFLFQHIGEVRMCGKNCSRSHLRRKVTADFVPRSEENRHHVGELRSFNWSASLSGTS